MYFVLSLLSLFSLLAQTFAQLKACYRWNGDSAPDFPCNPEADVSACCGGGYKCGTNLFCEDEYGAMLVGTCTDRSFTDPACPYALNAGNYDLESGLYGFDYKQNTTICPDATICPKNNFSKRENETCCENHKGRAEINYQNVAFLPEAKSDLDVPASPFPPTASTKPQPTPPTPQQPALPPRPAPPHSPQAPHQAPHPHPPQKKIPLPPQASAPEPKPV
ncbi:MAG: hypothetical protein Q9174_004044 [Haloplaca sp. 1 TL-2023]